MGGISTTGGRRDDVCPVEAQWVPVAVVVDATGGERLMRHA
jgi:hypothetical protein